jgi:hypothetical protein
MWERLWSLIVLPDPTIWAGIIGVVGAIIAGLLGGVIGGFAARKAALLGAENAHAHNVQLAANAAQAQVVAFVQAIRTEFDALYIFVNLTISPLIAQLDPKKPELTLRFVLSDDYFTIYRANANLLGNVDDAEVRDVIVRAYLKAQDFIDTIRTNNILVEQYEQITGEPLTGESLVASMMRSGHVKQTLGQLGKRVVDTHSVFIDAHAKLFDKTQAWLETKGVVFEPPARAA